MEKELEKSLARYAEIEKKLIANKEARNSLRIEAQSLREAYWAEEKVRNELVNKVAEAKAKADIKDN